MSEETPLTFQQLRDKMDELVKRIQKDAARKLPVDALFAEADRVLAVMDLFVAQHKGTPFYDQYWRARQTQGELPTLPPGFDPKWQ